nr:MAG TPA: hypothetical protein [Caudoviricetes sp.]
MVVISIIYHKKTAPSKVVFCSTFRVQFNVESILFL